MRIVRLPSSEIFSPCAVALGCFDGVHLAHRALLEETRRAAREKGLTFAVFTFDSASMLKADAPHITSDGEKADLFASLGVETLFLCDFRAVRDLSPEAFVREILLGTAQTRVAVVGDNFRFGKGASGDAKTLASLLAPTADCRVIPPIFYDGAPLSSTRIREYLADGDVKNASRALGADVKIAGTVERGISLAHKYGTPTVNLPLCGAAALLKHGVYRSVTRVGGAYHSSVTNIGICPTLPGRPPHAETHLIDFSGDLYGQYAEVFPLGFLREETVFPDRDSLFTQIRADIQTAKQLNGEQPWQEPGQN